MSFYAYAFVVVLTQTTGLLNHLKPLLCYDLRGFTGLEIGNVWTPYYGSMDSGRQGGNEAEIFMLVILGGSDLFNDINRWSLSAVEAYILEIVLK